MTDTMIERVAIALRKEAAMIGVGTDGMAVDVATYADLLARAAIEAMRPTDALANAAVDRAMAMSERGYDEKANVRFLNCYIDAALQETKP